MYRVGQKEVDAIAKVLLSGKLFRYHRGGECDRFERRYARFLGVKHVCMASSGTTALTAALVGLGIGPGDEVLVPACTYMATPVSVLAAGAIPVVVDIDETITLSPEAVEQAVGPRTRAVIPVHMWGLACNMTAIMRIARKRELLVVEDACQGVGGAYKGRMLGSIGHAGVFSFNYYKNMTCGEGGAVVTNDDYVAGRARCAVDCCSFYWTGRGKGPVSFVSNGSRASEIEGAMLNVQLDRIGSIVRALRRQKKRILRETADTGLKATPSNSPDYECGSHVMYTLPTEGQADGFAALAGGTVAGKTGRHVYTQWDPIFAHRGAHHPALNPFKLPQNRRCRKRYTKGMCAASLDILNRTVMMGTHPDRRRDRVTQVIKRIKAAAAEVLGPGSSGKKRR
ncbi:MAG: DegT/DnrJ/EryC1/StrS family aminotransferase [Candidatus Brocadiae bacterium]|nr:DegT/DnrJ/EryC1/StrS family aminotransferase [Candidatus Brocadiia bacterium]